MDREGAHQARVDAWLGPHLDRKRRGEKHPVEDFLFTYYNHKPSQLRRWFPGAAAAPEAKKPFIRWLLDLLTRTAERSPHFGCFGLHEWAMVYRAPEVRHPVPLRIDPGPVVESQKIACSHFDAYRFFTPAAAPLNLLRPTRETQADHEQPGCLHAGMDLYKWAYKLAPLIPAELVADCFALARDIRTVDMRASPYDLSAHGYLPIKIEEPQGRADYIRHQRAFTERAAPLRQRLIAECRRLTAP